MSVYSRYPSDKSVPQAESAPAQGGACVHELCGCGGLGGGSELGRAKRSQQSSRGASVHVLPQGAVRHIDYRAVRVGA